MDGATTWQGSGSHRPLVKKRKWPSGAGHPRIETGNDMATLVKSCALRWIEIITADLLNHAYMVVVYK